MEEKTNENYKHEDYHNFVAELIRKTENLIHDEIFSFLPGENKLDARVRVLLKGRVVQYLSVRTFGLMLMTTDKALKEREEKLINDEDVKNSVKEMCVDNE